MRGVRIPHKPIWAALAVGLVLIAFALFVGKAGTLPDANGQLAVVTDAPDRSFVPVADANHDGVPDWQESLIKTELIATTTSSSTSWDPQTLTEKFSVAFFESILRNETYGPLSETNNEIVIGATEALARQAVDTLFSRADITLVATNDPEGLRTYGNALADIIIKHPYESENEMVILQNALRANNPELLTGLDPILNAYRSMVIDMQLLPVPESFTNEHLMLLNSYFALANDIEAMRNVFADPMLAMLRMKRYEDDVIGMTQSLITVRKKFATSGVNFNESDSMYTLLPSSN